MPANLSHALCVLLCISLSVRYICEAEHADQTVVAIESGRNITPIS